MGNNDYVNISQNFALLKGKKILCVNRLNDYEMKVQVRNVLYCSERSKYTLIFKLETPYLFMYLFLFCFLKHSYGIYDIFEVLFFLFFM